VDKNRLKRFIGTFGNEKMIAVCEALNSATRCES